MSEQLRRLFGFAPKAPETPPPPPPPRALPFELRALKIDQYSQDAERGLAKKLDPVAARYKSARAELAFALSDFKSNFRRPGTIQKVRDRLADVVKVVAETAALDKETKQIAGHNHFAERAATDAYAKGLTAVLAKAEQTIAVETRVKAREEQIKRNRANGRPWYLGVTDMLVEDVAHRREEGSFKGNPSANNNTLQAATRFEKQIEDAKAFSVAQALVAELGSADLVAYERDRMVTSNVLQGQHANPDTALRDLKRAPVFDAALDAEIADLPDDDDVDLDLLARIKKDTSRLEALNAEAAKRTAELEAKLGGGNA